MKTKIIYISGSEIFNVADIRAAFDEVRTTLGLDSDTVFFGVPVDLDDAGIAPLVTEQPEIKAGAAAPESQTQAVEAPKKKTKKTITAKAVEEPTHEPIAETTNEKVIPILSVLSGKGEVSTEQDMDEPKAPIQKIEIIATETIEISDMMNDEAPEAEEEKTLEKLFEKIAPLREDHGEPTPVQTSEPEEELAEEDGVNATLEQLATEFANTQDKITPIQKSEGAGKIGKLKNILPFKKAKREEPGLMGDLFGWAGIAANDDDFSLPGFFAKK